MHRALFAYNLCGGDKDLSQVLARRCLLSCQEMSPPVPPHDRWDAQHVGLTSPDLKIHTMGHMYLKQQGCPWLFILWDIHIQKSRVVHGDLSDLYVYPQEE